MRKSNLLRHNASHLVVFQSLLTTGNVTATAAELHMSQPAVSRALAHLRQMFGDPLFVRAPGGVVPTERAAQLGPEVSQLVDDLAELVSPQAFDLENTDRTFRIATTDYGVGTVVLDFCAQFTRQAPRANIEIVPFSNDVFRDLAEGRLDLMLYADATIPDSLSSEFLFDETYSCVCRKGHPATEALEDGALTLESFLAWSHALVTVFGGRHGLIDTALRERGLERHIALRLPYFSTAPLIVADTDLLLTLPTRTAQYFARVASLDCMAAPLALPKFGYVQVWHPRTAEDPAMVWLRELIRETSVREGG